MDWGARIARATKRGKFYQTDKDLADDWCFCSLGERGIIPSEIDSVSAHKWVYDNVESDVKDQGISFSTAVESDDVQTAKRIHESIKAIPKENLLE